MNDRERKYQTANSGEITTNLYEDLDSKVETINYEEGVQKIRELQQKIAFMEKYIKELETSVHLQRTQNAVLRNKVDNTVQCNLDLVQSSLVIRNVLIRNKLVLTNHFQWPIVNSFHKNKEHLALRNNFRVTKKFLITKFDCMYIYWMEQD